MSSSDGVDVRTSELDALLPQTQCTRCGYPSCVAYAAAMSVGEARADRCSPGAEVVNRRLARALGEAPGPLADDVEPQGEWFVARIRAAECIGCTLCIQACPVDAIVGAAKRLHAVIESNCTGCDLCLPACPVDCIDRAPMVLDDANPLGDWMVARAPSARNRFQRREARRVLAAASREVRRAERRARYAAVPATRDARRALVAAALARSSARPDGPRPVDDEGACS